MKIIGLHGLPRSGKDTVASVLVRDRHYMRASFAEPLKAAAAVLLNRPVSQCHGIDYDREQIMPEWGFSMRWFLQRFGTEGIRDAIAVDFWTRRMKSTLDALADAGAPAVVITDVRFENETQALRERGAQIVEVRRPGTTASSHSSDRPVRCDWVFENHGTIDDLITHVLNEERF